MCNRQVLTWNKFALDLEDILFCFDTTMKSLKYTSHDHQCFYYEDALIHLVNTTNMLCQIGFAIPSGMLEAG